MNALILNCTLKTTPEKSSTQNLADEAVAEFERLKVKCETVRIVDLNILPGTSSNQGKGDEWPDVLAKIKESQILILATPIWVGHPSSVAQRVIERLDALFHEEDTMDTTTGQYLLYNKVAGIAITGNEDGAQECIAYLSWALGQLGCTIPPNANTYWIGPAGGDTDYIEIPKSKRTYTQELTLYMVHNLVFMAKLLQAHPFDTNLKSLEERAQKETSK